MRSLVGLLPLCATAIIESGLHAPEPGWIQNLNVLDPLIAEYGRGRLPEFPLGRDTVMDVVPVDLVHDDVTAGEVGVDPQLLPVGACGEAQRTGGE